VARRRAQSNRALGRGRAAPRQNLSASPRAASPQLASVEVLTSVLETALVSLSAAHPAIELDLKTRTDPVLSSDHLADRAVEQGIQLLDALARYRLVQYDIEHARHAARGERLLTPARSKRS
jgi:hypothetical protein